MKTYTIIGGVNGSGKSSLAGVLKNQRNDLGIIIDTDSLNERFGGDIIKGGKQAVKLIAQCLEKGVDFTQETTLSGKKTLRTVIGAKNADYTVRLFYVAVSSAEESISRIENRVRKGGHSIAAEDVVRRFGKRFDDLLRILPYCSEGYFYDNENGFCQAGEYRSGELIITSDSPPRWITELKEQLVQRQ